jgi:hypothetical protein
VAVERDGVFSIEKVYGLACKLGIAVDGLDSASGHIRRSSMLAIDDASKFLSVLKAMPLWLVVGCAAAGYAALFAPAFGGVDLAEFRRTWGPLFWLDAVGFSILSAAFIVEHVARHIRARAERRRLLYKKQYYTIYLPLYRELFGLKITTSSSMGAPFFSQRIGNAYRVLTTTQRQTRAIKGAWRALFDKEETPTTGDVEYGGRFPLREIGLVAKQNLGHSDLALTRLISCAERTRIEDGSRLSEMTADDVRLYDHIVNQYQRLKQLIEIH